MEVMEIDPIIFLYMLLSVFMLMAALTMVALYFPDRKSLPLMWSLLVIFMRQKLNIKVATDSLVSMRTLLIVWQFSALILTIMYSGYVFKSFASPKKLDTINSIEDLSEAQLAGQIDIYINKNSARYTELKVIIYSCK